MHGFFPWRPESQRATSTAYFRSLSPLEKNFSAKFGYETSANTFRKHDGKSTFEESRKRILDNETGYSNNSCEIVPQKNTDCSFYRIPMSDYTDIYLR
ncbi:unnamed protein product [Nezara viridula]|uniref:Uncharacterized protein n=1 Tax=Nezara viridula TaxID=85310 RepID=A0A9P0MP93_NEZVI|nr:unnamed protein product [Nezara viridula]